MEIHIQKLSANEYAQLDKEAAKHKELLASRYSLKTVKVTAERKCHLCGKLIKKGSKVHTRSAIETDGRSQRPRWATYYYCGCQKQETTA